MAALMAADADLDILRQAIAGAQPAASPAVAPTDPDLDILRQTLAGTPPTISRAQPAQTWLDRFGTGLLDPIWGALQLGSRAPISGAEPPPITWGSAQPQVTADTAAVDQTIRERERQYQEARRQATPGSADPEAMMAQPGGVDWARLGGNAASPVNFIPWGGAPMRGATIGRTILQNLPGAMIGGAASGAMQPATSDSPMLEKAVGAGTGLVAGGVLSPVGPAVAGAANPAVRMLRDAGVRLTPAQEGGALARVVQGFGERIPFVRSSLSGQQQEALSSFNTAAINSRVLSHIGDQLDAKGPQFGEDAIAAMNTKVHDFYQGLMPRLTLAPDNAYLNGLAQIEASLPDAVMRKRFYDTLSPTLTTRLTGDALKTVDSDLAMQANHARNIADIRDPDYIRLANAYRDARSLMRQNMAAQDPAAEQALRSADRAFASAQTINDAAARARKDGMIFTPGQLIDAGASARGATDRSVAEGGTALQRFGSAGQEVIGSRRSVGDRPATPMDIAVGHGVQTLAGLGGVGAGVAGETGVGPDWLSYVGLGAAPLALLTPPGRAILRSTGPGGGFRTGLASMLQQGPAAAAAGYTDRDLLPLLRGP